MKQIRKRVTYANVMSTIAVFLVLGGGAAYAAKKIGGNQLKGGSVTKAKIRRGAVTASKIRKGAVKANKISKGAVKANKISNGAVTNAKLANGAVTLEKLVPGFTAPAAEKLTHAADISSEGTVLAGSVGIAQANVSHTKVGFYCFSGLNPAPVGGVATVDYSESGETIVAQLDTGPGPGTGSNAVCPTGTQAFVNTRLVSLPGEKDPNRLKAPPADAGFFVVFY